MTRTRDPNDDAPLTREEWSHDLLDAEARQAARDPGWQAGEPTDQERELLELAQGAVDLAERAYQAAMDEAGRSDIHAVGLGGMAAGVFVPTTLDMQRADMDVLEARNHLNSLTRRIGATRWQRAEMARTAARRRPVPA